MNFELYERLNDIQKDNYVRFHMPGHKGRNLYNIDFDWFNLDFTEINGTDNLHNSQEILKKIQREISEIYNSKESYMLINGTTVGIIASILSVCSSKDKFIIPRNSHKAVYSGVILGNIDPIYIYPEEDEKFGYHISLDAKKIENLIIKNPEVKGIIITNPTYYGTCSDIINIKSIVDKYSKILIVDEAHGGHLKFNNKYPTSAIDVNADIVIQSTHKTMTAFTQGSLLHVCSNKVDIHRIRNYLSMLQSSSPSYPLMMSLEMAIKYANKNGKEILNYLEKYYNIVRESFNNTNFSMMCKTIKNNSIFHYDISKLWIDVTETGLTGVEINNILREKYNIQIEMADDFSILAMMGMGTTLSDITKLITALKQIDYSYNKKNTLVKPYMKLPKVEKIINPGETTFLGKKKINYNKSMGRICGDYVIPYPPGTPILIPGEKINNEIINYINNQISKGIDIIGIDNKKDITIIDI